VAEAGLRRRFGVLLDAFQTQLWPLPVVGVTLALVLGVALPVVDARIDDGLSTTSKAYLFGGDPTRPGQSSVPWSARWSP